MAAATNLRNRAGNPWAGRPKATRWQSAGGANRIDLFVRGQDSFVYHKSYDGAHWLPSQAGWEPLGGAGSGDPAVAAWGPNRLDVFIKGTDNGVWHRAFDGSQWLPANFGWDPLGGVITGLPSVVSWGPNRLDIFVEDELQVVSYKPLKE